MSQNRRISLGQGLTILANFGVIVGLVFVVLELQQTRVSLQAEVELGLLETQQTTTRAVADNPDLGRVVMKAYTAPETLEPDQFLGFLSHLADQQATVYAAWELWQLGAIDDAAWERHANLHAFGFSTEWTKAQWLGNSTGLYPQEFVDDIVARFPENIDWEAAARAEGLIGN